MKRIRRIHGWLGVLFAPSIILFALTGALQMFGLHETERGETPGFVAKIAMIHTHQTATIPQRATRPPQADAPGPDARKADAARAESPNTEAARAESSKTERAKAEAPKAERPTTLPLKLLFLGMAVSLIVSSVLGVWIAFTSKRDRNLHLGLFVAGVVLPVVLLLV